MLLTSRTEQSKSFDHYDIQTYVHFHNKIIHTYEHASVSHM